MHCHRDASAAPRPGRPRFEVADVFRAHGETYRQSHALTADQLKVMRAIELCRTEALGGHLDECPDPGCGFERPAYNSCRNRHCPKCQYLEQARWLERRLRHILPTHYFHVIFTIPAALRPLALANRKLLFDLLFATASRTLLDLGDDPKYIGARLGITAVLHTWTRKLTFHPHLHCIVTGGGLAPSGDDWVPCSRRFIFPVQVLGALFRGKFLDGLRRLRRQGSLCYIGGAANLVDDDVFAQLLDRLYRTPWVVYAKRPFAGAQHVFRYLGRYTHRVGLSNHRILAIDDNAVRFLTKDGDAITLNHEEFTRRFLNHVLPTGFTKIRHFGLYASSNVNNKLERAKDLLNANRTESPQPDEPAQSTDAEELADDSEPTSWQELLLRLTGIDPRLCPRCGQTLRRRRLLRMPPDYEDSS